MQTRLRYWEYYGMTETFDGLYEKSKKGYLLTVFTISSHQEKISYLPFAQSKQIRVQKQRVQMEELLTTSRSFQKKN